MISTLYLLRKIFNVDIDIHREQLYIFKNMQPSFKIVIYAHDFKQLLQFFMCIQRSLKNSLI